MAAIRTQTVTASSAKTATGNSGALAAAPTSKVALAVNVTVVSGTSPTLDLSVEWSHDGSTFIPAETADAFTQITGVTSAVAEFTVKAPVYRVVWTIGGTTPSFTFDMEAAQVG